MFPDGVDTQITVYTAQSGPEPEPGKKSEGRGSCPGDAAYCSKKRPAGANRAQAVMRSRQALIGMGNYANKCLRLKAHRRPPFPEMPPVLPHAPFSACFSFPFWVFPETPYGEIFPVWAFRSILKVEKPYATGLET